MLSKRFFKKFSFKKKKSKKKKALKKGLEMCLKGVSKGIVKIEFSKFFLRKMKVQTRVHKRVSRKKFQQKE